MHVKVREEKRKWLSTHISKLYSMLRLRSILRARGRAHPHKRPMNARPWTRTCCRGRTGKGFLWMLSVDARGFLWMFSVDAFCGCKCRVCFLWMRGAFSGCEGLSLDARGRIPIVRSLTLLPSLPSFSPSISRKFTQPEVASCSVAIRALRISVRRDAAG